MASVATRCPSQLWHCCSNSILPCFLDLSGDETYVRPWSPNFPPPPRSTCSDFSPGSHLVALSLILIEGLSRHLDSSHEKLLDSIVSASSSVSPSVSPSYLDVKLPGKHNFTAASNDSNHHSAHEASDTVDDSRDADVRIEKHETLPTPSKLPLAYTLSAASSGNAIPSLQRTQMSSTYQDKVSCPRVTTVNR